MFRLLGRGVERLRRGEHHQEGDRRPEQGAGESSGEDRERRLANVGCLDEMATPTGADGAGFRLAAPLGGEHHEDDEDEQDSHRSRKSRTS